MVSLFNIINSFDSNIKNDFISNIATSMLTAQLEHYSVRCKNLKLKMKKIILLLLCIANLLQYGQLGQPRRRSYHDNPVFKFGFSDKPSY
jgi:hypothetical protein